MSLQRGERVRRFHIGYESHVDLRDGAMRQNRFAAGARITAHESFYVYSRLRFEPFVCLLPRQIIDPMLHTDCFFASASLRVFDTFSSIAFSSVLSGSGFG